MLSNDENWLADVLEANTSEETSPEDKISIRLTVGRLRRILNWNPGKDGDLLDKSRGPEFVKDILGYFVRWKASACNSDRLADTHLVVYTLAELCFFYWIQDSDMVAEVLRHVYSYDGTFNSMFSHIIQHRTARRKLARLETREERHSTLLFFLSHTHRLKLLFDGIRFVNVGLQVPLSFWHLNSAFMAATYYDPKLLLLLLRHGASMDWRTEVGIYVVGMASRDWDLYLLLQQLIQMLWSSWGPGFDKAVVSNHESDAWACLRIVMRTVRQVPIGKLNFTLENYDATRVTESKNSHDLIRNISERGILPHLARRYLDPAELQHLCRCTIREALNRNWNLPSGISTLPMPKSIQTYIDLLKD